ncbi:MAG TPA: hypothetical protein VF613_12770, partial [Longimicrobium sp.]
MVEWSRLRAHREGQWKSFENVCYQLAVNEFGGRGKFTSIDDSGGGDGVEFYLTLADGTEWGWQAKFYHPHPRLDPSRRRSVSESLERSLQRHPRLAKWFLCTPSSFTPTGRTSELRWWEGLQARHPGVDLVHWNDRELSRLLVQARNAGTRTAFFGNLALDPEWFRTRLDIQLANLRDRYDPELHTETQVDYRLHCLAHDSVWRKGFGAALEKAQAALHHLEDDWADIQDLQSAGELFPAAAELVAAAEGVVELMATFAAFPGAHRSDGRARVREAGGRLEGARLAYVMATLGAFDPRMLDAPDLGGGTAGPNTVQRMGQPANWSVVILQHLHLVDELFEDASRPAMHVLGAAGAGKTHTAAHACEVALRAGRAALLLHGVRFHRSSSLEAQILDQVGLGGACTWGEFVGALEAYARATASPAFIVIDALNEAEHPASWRQSLPGLLRSLADHPHVRVVTTCRPSYVPSVWGGTPDHAVETRGFSPAEVPQALRRYFARYRLVVDMTLVPLEQFRNPLYLKIFCESENPRRGAPKEVFLGTQTLFRVLARYVARASESVCGRVDERPVATFVEAALTPLCEALWRSRRRTLGFEEARALLDGNSPGWERSVTHALLDEGLLVHRDMSEQEGEQLGFTYDLLGGFLIARWLLSKVDRASVREFVEDGSLLAALSSPELSERHPLHEDILRGIAAAMPEAVGEHLFAVAGDPALRGAGVGALFEMDPQWITEGALGVVADAFAEPENRLPLLHYLPLTAFSPAHPLNMRFWDPLLRALPMRDRDLSWTVCVASTIAGWEWLAREVEWVGRNPRRGGPAAEERLDLAACALHWVMAGTARDLRDLATKALYWYGRRRPGALVELALRSFSVDDPYVRERCFAACFGVAMALHADPAAGEYRQTVLPYAARALYGKMFAEGAPNGTTHALLRDYAAGLIQLAVRVHPGLFAPGELARAAPPFPEPSGRGDVTLWGTLDDAAALWDRGAPLDMDFLNYTVGHMVPGRRLYDDNHPGYREVSGKLRWRMHNLGYRSELFGGLDRRDEPVALLPPVHSPQPLVERFGKKYGLIAYHELYGWQSDRGILPDAYPGAGGRPTELDLDPSFPDPPHPVRVVDADFLPDRSVTPREWVEAGAVPLFTPWLVRPELLGERGPWVLLDTVLEHEDRSTRHGLLVVVRSVFAHARDARAFAGELAGVSPGHRGIPEPPRDMYTFAGEIPWRATFPATEPERIRLAHSRSGSDRTYDVLPAVRVNEWERRIGTGRAYRVAVPAKRMLLDLGLWMRLPSWDLHEPDGARATISVLWDRDGVRQATTWMRKD